ncbi:MAG: hypothetical protein WC219_04285 [Acholeplasmataceae bacterium]
MWFLWILIVFIFVVGIAMIIKPVWFLELQDIFRTDSDVDYSDFAIVMMIVSGIGMILFGIFLIFKVFVL